MVPVRGREAATKCTREIPGKFWGFANTMISKDTEAFWSSTYRLLSEEAAAFRNSQADSFGLLEAHDALTPNEKECVHSILADWFVSDDNKLRYDAVFY